MKLTKTVILLIFIVISIIGSTIILKQVYYNPQSQQPTTHQTTITEKQQAPKGFSIYMSTTLPLLYYNPQTTIPFVQVCKNNNYLACINGSYFKTDKTHAGLLCTNGHIITPIDKNDKQISQIVIIDTQKSTMQISNVDQFSIDLCSNQHLLIFQTGPVIIKNNQIQNKEIIQSLNGEGAYKRSILGYTNDNKFFVAATEQNVTLKEFAQQILSTSPTKNNVKLAVNLDGGPSTAFYTQENGLEIESTTKKLPIILGFK